MTSDELIRQLRWLSANLTLPVNGWVICRDAADDLERLTKRVAELERTLKAIAMLGGNIADEHYTDRTGPNDAAHRGLMYVESRRLANEALEVLVNG